MPSKIKILILFYIFILVSLTIYSYSQIDLNLTLSSNSLYQLFQNQMIQLGYFNRPLSTAIFLIILFLLFTIYYLLLKLVEQKKLSLAGSLWLIIASSIIIFFAYPAFSHDFFNYMFDARIVTKYHANPYLFKALDFPDDLWIRFMHWTHRTYPYGPIWLLLTIPFSFLGFGKFVLTLLNFKLMFLLFHFCNIYLIYKILKKISPKNAIIGMAFYAFNPLIQIESIVSPHNEVVMLTFLLLGIYLFFIQQRKTFAILSLLFSVGIKFVTLILLPFFVLYPKKKINWLLKSILFMLIGALFVEIIYREPYPWYFILPIGVGALLVENYIIRIVAVLTSLGVLLRYAPYLYQGNYNSEAVTFQNWIFYSFLFLILMFVIFNLAKKLIRIKE